MGEASRPGPPKSLLREARPFRNSWHADCGSQNRRDSDVNSFRQRRGAFVVPRTRSCRCPVSGISSFRREEPITRRHTVGGRDQFSRRWGSIQCRVQAAMWVMKFLIMWIPRHWTISNVIWAFSPEVEVPSASHEFSASLPWCLAHAGVGFNGCLR